MDHTLRIAICEDLPADRELLLRRIRESGVPAKCETHESGEAFLKTFKPGLYHLVYLDIYMDGLTGMQTAAAIREQDEAVLLAFTTTSHDHAFEANKYRSLLYIEKPVTQEMVSHTLTLAASLRETKRSQVLTISAEKKRLDIRHDDIVYAEVLGQRCILHLWERGGLDVSTNFNIDDLEAMLPTPRFLRTHRSYIVNLDMVKRSNGTDFVMKDGGIAYITQRDYRRIMRLYDEWLFGQAREDRL